MRFVEDKSVIEKEGILLPNTSVKADCFDVLKFIPSKSVDCILADLPYGTTQCKWDSVLDLPKLWIEYERIIKDNGVILLFAQTPFDKVLGVSNLKLLRYEWIWEKTQATGHYNVKKMPMKAHENILVFYKKRPKYYPQKTEGHKPTNWRKKTIDLQNKTSVYGKATKEIVGGGDTDRYPRDVLKFASDKQKLKYHDTQKPVALCKYFLNTYTDEGDVVLDNTAGSGTTGIAATQLNRQSILIEKTIKSFNDIKTRFSKEI